MLPTADRARRATAATMAEAEQFADACVAALAATRHVDRDRVERQIFSGRYIGRHVMGLPPIAAEVAVADALRIYPPERLGLHSDSGTQAEEPTR